MTAPRPSPFAPEHLQDPYAALAALRAGGPVQCVEGPAGVETWVVLGYEEVLAALRDERISTDPRHARDAFRRAGLVIEAEGDDPPPSLLTSDPPDHTRLRRLVSRAFTPRRAAALRGEVQEIVDGLLDAIAPAGRADLVASLAFPLPVTVITRLLGVPTEDREDFRRWTMEMQTPPTVPDAAERKLAGKEAMHAYLRAFVDAKRAALVPGADDDAHADLASALVAAADSEGQLTEPELIALLEELLIGGYETAANFIANALRALLAHPAQLELLRREPDRTGDAVEELLRYDGSVLRAVPRAATADVTLGGTTIPAGSLVTIVLGAANRDPAHVPDADRLDVTRPPSRHLAFGHGIHFCPGAGLARVEAEVALAATVRRLPGLRLDGEARWRPAGVMRALEALPVAFDADRAVALGTERATVA